MKMNVKSWHSHIIDQYTDSRAVGISNFCPYVRKVIRGVFNILGIIVGISLAAYIFVFGWIATAAAVYMQGFSAGMEFIAVNYVQWLIGDFLTMGFILAVCGFLLEQHVSAKRRAAKHKKEIAVAAQKQAGTYVAPEQGLIVTWYKANHDKICPTLDW